MHDEPVTTQYTYRYTYIYIYICTYDISKKVYIHTYTPPIYIYIWSGVWRSHPPPPPGGGGVCGEWSGRLGGVLLWAARGHREGRDLTEPYASHKPYNVGRVPVFINA